MVEESWWPECTKWLTAQSGQPFEPPRVPQQTVTACPMR
jgi:hypothetical protein